MSTSQEKQTIIYPDYLEGQSDHVKRVWMKWTAISEKIDNYPERFYTVSNQSTGGTKIIDCKATLGISRKRAREFGASKKEIEDIVRISTDLQRLKVDKATLNKEWTKEAFGNKRGEKTILDVRYSEVLDLFGKFYTADEIRKLIAENWGLQIKYEEIKKFYNNNLDKIERKRAEYVLSAKESRFATDAGRMEALSNLAWEIEAKFEKHKSIEYSKELRAIIEQIRKEIKGEEIRLTVEGKIDINATIQANQTVHEALQKLPINMIVIGLTAAKQGLNPASLIGSLANSYYSKFNGFNKLGDKKDLQLPGQYIKTYNWEEIRQKNEQNIIDIEPIEVYEEAILEQKKVEVKTKKQIMLELLESYKSQTNENKPTR